MEITRNGTQPSNKAPADHFTGAVRVDPLFQAPDPGLVSGASVTLSQALELRGTRIRAGKLYL